MKRLLIVEDKESLALMLRETVASEGLEADVVSNGNDAINRLEAIRARGAQYLLLPATAVWWLDHYPKFREHLESHCPIVMRDENTCLIFDLCESSNIPPSSK